LLKWTRLLAHSTCRHTIRLTTPERRPLKSAPRETRKIEERGGDGLKLKPTVIFKRKTVPKINNKHGVIVSAQEKGYLMYL